MEELYDQRVKEVNELRAKWRQIQQENQQNPEYVKTVALAKRLNENLDKINKFLIEFNVSSDKLLNTIADENVLEMQDSSSAREFIKLIRMVFAMFKQVSQKNAGFVSPVLTKEAIADIETNLTFIQKFYEDISENNDELRKLVKDEKSLFVPSEEEIDQQTVQEEADSTILTIVSDDVSASSPC